ncbi:ABC transporter ATP-binding protein [Coprobacter tertius]|uniref:ABC transporter ATP-binding protein/permease n=1 Tax=Coprobacter tertius TaxID=2944915 RepID=A0ABT1MI67_9BACT|nr:ABC transporter ATP-binding protein [Coprobacter tertius]MCP9612328.1 ABC transporter ATP-binding protein/permease [Coprobacter tertius]
MKDFIKILLRFVPPYKKYLFLNIFFNILSTVLSLFSFALLIPILQILFKINEAHYEYMQLGSASFKDVFINNFYYYITLFIENHGGALTLMLLGALLVVMTFFKTFTSYLSSYFMIPIRSGVVRDIRNYVFSKVVSLPIGFFTTERKGDVMARMTGDVSEIENSIMSSLDMMFKNPIMIIVYLTTMFLVSWQLTLFVMVLLPISGYIMGKVGKKLKRNSVEAQQQWGTLMAQIEETLGGLRIIKAFNAERKIKDRFITANNKFFKLTNRISRRQALAHPMSEFLGTFTIAIVLWYGGSLILGGKSSIDAASFIYYLVIFYSIINPAKDFSKAAYAVQRGLASMERVDKILSAENPIKSPEHPVNKSSLDKKIEYRNVSFKYKTDWVIKDVSIEIPKGQTIALVGQSGSGKSTMADLLPRFYDVDKGGVFIDGVNIKDMTPLQLRSMMGNVNQEAILFNDTFFNNIAFGVEGATMERVIEAAKIANAHDFIIATENGYDTNIGDRGCRLSGGQRQRISIARAILKNPAILILDEATSALDTESERLVQEALENLMKNRTTIVIAHRLSTIKDANKIYVMHEGEIVEEGTHDELIALNRYYKRLVDMQKF